jgi:hypothetical protein
MKKKVSSEKSCIDEDIEQEVVKESSLALV